MGSPLVEQFKAGGVALELRLLAAQGALPLGPADLLELLAHLTADTDERVRMASAEALAQKDAADLLPFASDRATSPQVLAWLVEHRQEDALRGAAIQNPSTPSEAIERVAASLSAGETGGLAELVVINQKRLIEHPGLLEALEANPDLNKDQKRRLMEFRQDFRKQEQAAPPPPPPPPPPAPEPEPEPEAVADVAVYLDATERTDAAKVGAFQRLFRMTTAEKLMTALKGTREERAILVRDPNRLVWSGVLSSPKLTGAEVEAFASMKNVSEHALREIGSRREWTRHPGVASGLVKNPRTPTGIALTLVPMLGVADRKALAKDRNVPEAIRRAAQRFTNS